jgi:FMN phosphatase YigB (HAD superfamily)
MTSIRKPRPKIGLLVLDLDNTLWDWVDVWVNSFSAMLSELVAETGLPEQQLKDEMRTVHQSRGTSEYSFLLDELPSLKPYLRGTTVRKRFDEVLHRQNSVRKHQTALYPTVLPTLVSLKSQGVKIVAYTESLGYWTEWRIRQTGLDGVIDVLYSARDHDFPRGVTRRQVRTLKKDQYGLKQTEHRYVDRDVIKPDPRILEEIVNEYGGGVTGIAYVGDNVSKDIVMAQRVGLYDVHAAYGEAHKRPEYELLRDVTHWTQEMIDRERDTRPGVLPKPSYVLRKNLAEILDLFDFGPPLDVNSHLELWKKAVDVQQHFNDIGWRIRALALTAMTFAFGAAGFAYVNAGTVQLGRLGDVSLAALVPVVGLVLWASFWFMDALWFHRLLYGAVRDGGRLERVLRWAGVRADLGNAIGKASPVRRLHSTHKLHLFYAFGAFALTGSIIVFALIGPRPEGLAPTPAPTVVNNINVEQAPPAPLPTP